MKRLCSWFASLLAYLSLIAAVVFSGIVITIITGIAFVISLVMLLGDFLWQVKLMVKEYRKSK